MLPQKCWDFIFIATLNELATGFQNVGKEEERRRARREERARKKNTREGRDDAHLKREGFGVFVSFWLKRGKPEHYLQVILINVCSFCKHYSINVRSSKYN